METFSINAILIYITIFSSCDTRVMCVLTISPSVIAPVCHVEERLKFTCSTTVATFLRWRLSVFDEQLQASRNIERNINSYDSGTLASDATVNSTSFHFIRTSNEDASPLISTLTITNVTNNLNGTRVHCMEVDGSMSANFTTIIIAEAGHSYANISANISSVNYSSHEINVTISLKLPQRYASHNVSITPHVPINSTLDGITHIILVTLSYNVKYNLSVEVKVLCRDNMASFFYLYYANCDYSLPSIDSMLKVTGYSGPLALEGTTVNFHCSSGLVLIGNTSVATCNAQGQWEPDPNGLTCAEAGEICGSPLPDLESLNDSTQGVKAHSELDVSLQTVVYFSCPDGLLLMGPNTTTCVNNSHWVPDPTDIKCIDIDAGDICASPLPESLWSVQRTVTYTKMDLLTVVKFSCPKGLLLIGPNTTTCVNNSHWVPDPTDVKCINTDGLCDSGKMAEMNGETAAVAVSLVVVLLVSVIFMYIIGFISGHCFTLRRMAHSGEKLAETSQLPKQDNSAYEYECIQTNVPDSHLELKKNVAYRPVQSNKE